MNNEKKHERPAPSSVDGQESRAKKPKLNGHDDSQAQTQSQSQPQPASSSGEAAAGQPQAQAPPQPVISGPFSVQAPPPPAPLNAPAALPSHTAAASSAAQPAAAATVGAGAAAATVEIKQETAGSTAASGATTTGGSDAAPSATSAAPVNAEEEQRRKQEEMKRIELEFSQLKEKFFAEKIAALKKEIDQLTQGTHEGYLNEIKLLEEKKQRKILQAEQWRQYQIQCLNNAYEAERKHSEDEINNDAKELQEKMLKNMLKRRKQLEEQKAELNLSDTSPYVVGLGQRSRDGGPMRNLRSRPKASQLALQMELASASASTSAAAAASEGASRRPQAPEVRVTLNDDEIDSDFAVIQRVR